MAPSKTSDSEDDARQYAEGIINAVREPLIILDNDLRVIFASRSFYSAFKVRPEETLGQLIYDLGNKQWDIPQLRQLLETLLPRQTSLEDYEVEHEFTDIGRRTMLLNALEIHRKSGKERHILLAVEDITERKRQENLLSESEERYRRLFETANDGIVLLEKAEGKITHANPAITEMFGYSHDEFIGKSVIDIGFPGDIGTIQEISQTLEKDGILTYKDAPVQIKSAQVVFTDIYMVDRAKLVQVNLRDVTERKRMAEAYENERAYLSAVIDNIGEAIVICDAEGRIVRFNETARRLHGLPEQSIPSDLWAQAQHYDLYQEDGITPMPIKDTPLFRALQGECVKDVEIVVAAKHSRPYFLVCNGQALTDETGKIYGAVVAMHDITERKQAEKEKERLQAQFSQAQKMESVGRLAGGVAHDFNNKLTVINGYAEMMAAVLPSSDPMYESVQQIHTAGKQSEAIVRQLLAFARKQTISPVQLDLNDTISPMLKMLQRLIGENIGLEWHPGKNLYRVKIDPSQVDQIMANLSLNARDSISDVGKVTIETKNTVVDEDYCKNNPEAIPGRYAMLVVSDDGCGMEKEVKDQLFEPFFTTKEVGKGSGLGLPSVYGIVKHNNGFINVYSEPGEGTVFKIYLPRHEAEESFLKPVIESGGQMPVGAETILIVEDEKAILQLSRRMLERLGYTVQTSSNPSEALKLSGEYDGTIHLLITDVVMPEMNGRDLSSRLTRLHPALKTLYMSGYTADVIAHHGVLDEGVQFIQKPFSLKDLAVKVREALEQE